MTTTQPSTLIRVADLAAHITSNTVDVTDWATRYFGSWWNAIPDATADVGENPVVVRADVDPGHVQKVADEVHALDHRTVSYARKPLHLAHLGDGSILAYGDDEVAYHVESSYQISVVGTASGRVASAACRLARESLRGQLARDGWVLMHASAAVGPSGRALIAFGGKGAGKTSTVLQLARAKGWAVLANDRFFARAGDNGDVELLPWPAAAAIGLGLLDAMGWFEATVKAWDALHSSTPSAVLDALAQGRREPLFDGDREAKAQVFPDQITSLFGLPLADYATAEGLLFPSVDPDSVPAAHVGGRNLSDDDTFVGDIEDRYPNVWNLAHRETTEVRDAVFDKLNRLPRHTLTLSHNIVGNTAILASL